MSSLSVLILVFLFGICMGNAIGSSVNGTISCPERCNLKNGFCQPNGKCKCYKGWRGANCDQCALADGCMHGTCDKPLECKCKDGYSGRHCQLDMKYCERHSPCRNNATCINDGNGSYVCLCRHGYTGKTCALHTLPQRIPTPPPKSPEPFCLNGGVCVFGNDIVGCEKCECANGYIGTRCESRVRMCVTRPCANGGECINVGDSFRCECASGYTGRYCTNDVNECAILGADACRNGGVCINSKGSFTCKCNVGFEGARCENPIKRHVFPSPTLKTATSSVAEPDSLNEDEKIADSNRGMAMLDQILNYRESPVKEDAGLNSAKNTRKQESTNIKVTHILRQVEVKSSHSELSLVGHVMDSLSAEPQSADHSSVSVVQAVTFAFLGVAVVLFFGIALFLWRHCKKGGKCVLTRRDITKSESLLEKGHEPEKRGSIVRTSVPASKKAGYWPKPGLAVRTITPPGGQLNTKSPQHIDCLYVALPREQRVHATASVSSIDETNNLLESSRMTRSANFYHQ